MTKLQRMLTSLVAVIPAAFLIYLLVMAMLSHSENLSTMAYIVMVVTLLSMVATVGIPVGIMVGGGNKAAAPVKAAGKTAAVKQESSEVIETLDDEDSASGASSGSFDAHDVLQESSEFDLGNSDQDMLGGDSEAEIETEPVEDLDDFDLEEVEEEEEAPKPKKKKH